MGMATFGMGVLSSVVEMRPRIVAVAGMAGEAPCDFVLQAPEPAAA